MSIETDIADLRLRVAALEAEASSETLQPNYLTINPANGQVGANFSGVVNASGLFLPEGTQATGFYAAPSAVQWNDPGANVQEFIQGHTFNGNHILDLIAGTPVEWSNSQVAYLELLNELPGTNYQLITVRTGNPFNQLLDSNNKSDWVRYYSASPQAVYVLAGFVTVTWPGGSPVTSATQITGPAFVNGEECIAGCQSTTNGLAIAYAAAQYAGGNPAVFNIFAVDSSGGSPGAGTQWNIYWIALAN